MSDTKPNDEILTLLEQYATQKRFYGKSYPKIPFVFSHNERDFIVEEIPLYPFSNTGEHRILKVRKKNISTLECVKLIAQALHIKEREMGYAGLKDKHALTYQHISVPNKAFKAYESNLHKIDQIKILESCLHGNKIKIGHLKGNKFFIRLKKVTPQSFDRIKEEALLAQKQGFPNFFGYQRFGNFGDNYIQALQIKKPPNKQNPLEQLLISSLQSVCFNLWLEERLKISNIMQSFSPKDSMQALSHLYNITMDREIFEILHKHALPLTPLIGDVCMHYPHGKFFYFGDKRSNDLDSMDNTQAILDDVERLKNGSISITGLLSSMECKKILDSQPNQGGLRGLGRNYWNLDSKNYNINPTTHLDLTQNLDSNNFAPTQMGENLDSKNCHVEHSETSLRDSIKDCLPTAQKDSTQHTESKSTQNRVRLAKQDAYIIEQKFAYPIMANGTRRYAWVYPTDLNLKYNAEKAQVEIAFTLPSGAYATSFLSYIKNGDVREF